MFFLLVECLFFIGEILLWFFFEWVELEIVCDEVLFVSGELVWLNVWEWMFIGEVLCWFLLWKFLVMFFNYLFDFGFLFCGGEIFGFKFCVMCVGVFFMIFRLNGFLVWLLRVIVFYFGYFVDWLDGGKLCWVFFIG